MSKNEVEAVVCIVVAIGIATLGPKLIDAMVAGILSLSTSL